ncbi:MAG: hypothetical protein QW594_00765 [Candidatus Woesearchaeota archaeon]
MTNNLDGMLRFSSTPGASTNQPNQSLEEQLHQLLFNEEMRKAVSSVLLGLYQEVINNLLSYDSKYVDSLANYVGNYLHHFDSTKSLDITKNHVGSVLTTTADSIVKGVHQFIHYPEVEYDFFYPPSSSTDLSRATPDAEKKLILLKKSKELNFIYHIGILYLNEEQRRTHLKNNIIYPKEFDLTSCLKDTLTLGNDLQQAYATSNYAPQLHALLDNLRSLQEQTKEGS